MEKVAEIELASTWCHIIRMEILMDLWRELLSRLVGSYIIKQKNPSQVLLLSNLNRPLINRYPHARPA